MDFAKCCFYINWDSHLDFTFNLSVLWVTLSVVQMLNQDFLDKLCLDRMIVVLIQFWKTLLTCLKSLCINIQERSTVPHSLSFAVFGFGVQNDTHLIGWTGNFPSSSLFWKSSCRISFISSLIIWQHLPGMLFMFRFFQLLHVWKAL